MKFEYEYPKSQIHSSASHVAQRKPNKTGLPDKLKSGIENLSGHSMDDVKVHYNSSRPAQLQAHAFAQGNQIHLAPGQEKHLPHEAWHVVQQKQGRVKPTMQLNGDRIKESINLIQRTSGPKRHLKNLFGTGQKKAPIRGVFEPRITGKKSLKEWLNLLLPKEIRNFLTKKNKSHSLGSRSLRGQESNNILHTSNIISTKPYKREKHQAFMRHLSTLLNTLRDDFVEVQSAISFNDQNQNSGYIYISANTKESYLINDWGQIMSLAILRAKSPVRMTSRSKKRRHLPLKKDKRTKVFRIKNIRIKGRLQRHIRKAIDSIKYYRNFEIKIVEGKPNQHAETKILDKILEDRRTNALFGGLRRPCGACRVYFQLRKSQIYLPAHTGQLWTTHAALLSITNLARRDILQTNQNGPINKNEALRIIESWLKRNSRNFNLDKNTYIQHGQTVQSARNNDTDSEEDEDAVGLSKSNRKIRSKSAKSARSGRAGKKKSPTI